jgi:hypothetical protein
MPKAFSIANLASPEILPAHAEPWLTAPAIPSFETRESYKKWMASPSTTVPLFSLVEGENPGIRMGASNPGYRVWGLVTDYDATLTEDEIAAGLARVPADYPVFAWNRTRRGGIRVVWAFEAPVFFYGNDTYRRLMQRAKKELKLTTLFPGLDEEALEKPDQTYAAGNGWTVNNAAVIRSATLGMWLFDVLRSTKDFDRELEIPLDVVKAEVDARFPGRWKGDFREGARGLRFWDPAADNPTAAIVRKTGMTAFTGDRAFLSWADIFGHAFVAKYQEDRIGRAVADMYADNEQHYYRRITNGDWDRIGIEAARRHLKGTYNLSDSVRKGESLSEVDRVLHHLEMNRRIEGALPFPHRPESVIEWHGNTYVNTAANRVRLMKPSDAPANWGSDFPFISQFLTTLLVDEQNLVVFLAWLKHWYKSCYEGRPQRGQAVFIAGPTGTGKSFLSLELLSSIFGGYADVRQCFVEGARFNSSMFDRAVWSLDDSTILGDRRNHQKFSGIMKACVANPSMPYEKKYGYSGHCPFTGRFICTLNDDPVSLGILPDTDQSLLDKVILLRSDAYQAVVAETPEKNHEIVMSELPSFLRWLLDWEVPEWVKLDSRFGIQAWHDTQILEEARSVSDSLTVLQAVELFINDYTPAVEGEPWTGNATALYGAMQANEAVAAVTRRLNPVSLGRQIRAAISSGCKWIVRGREARSKLWIYKIYKPETRHETTPATPV